MTERACRTCVWWGTASKAAAIRLRAAGVCRKAGGPRENEAVVALERCEAWAFAGRVLADPDGEC